MSEKTTRYQAAIVKNHRILMLKVWDHAFSGRTFWVIPGGGCNPNESEQECVRREVREETNLDVEVGPLILDEQESSGDMLQKVKTYACTIVGGDPLPGSEPEVDTNGTRIRLISMPDEVHD